jgi:hypothetical protein
MLLRILLVLVAVLAVASLLQTISPAAAERAARRRRAWKFAVRKTAYSLGSLGFFLAACFGAWHALRFDDRTAWALAAMAAPLAAWLAFLSYRTGHRVG